MLSKMWIFHHFVSATEVRSPHGYICKDQFIDKFIPKIKKTLEILKMLVKAVLVLDNASTHPEELECKSEPEKTVFPITCDKSNTTDGPRSLAFQKEW